MSEAKHKVTGPFSYSLSIPGRKFEAQVWDENGEALLHLWPDSRCIGPVADALVMLFAAAPELLRYAQLEAEYTRLCDRRRPDYDASELLQWIEANGIGDQPVGLWLKTIRDEAIRKATGEQ